VILDEHKILFLIVGGVLILLVASPFLSRILVLPRTEFFSELWLLGPNHMAEDYPSNITSGNEYSVFLGIGNRLGYAAYYKVLVKFRSQNQSAADSFNRTPSSLPALYEIRTFVADEEIWEIPLAFSFNHLYNESLLQVDVISLTLNAIELENLDYIISWDSARSVFFGNLFFELWIYNASSNSFQYHERFVDLKFNMTSPALT